MFKISIIMDYGPSRWRSIHNRRCSNFH